MMKMQMQMEPKKIRPQMDWQQVALNGGPPCFAVLDDEDGYYCGRAERWEGHNGEHGFISLDALLDRAETDSLKGICVYCGEVQQYESLEQKGSEQGNQIRIEHIKRCTQRPELKLINYIETLRAALTQFVHWYAEDSSEYNRDCAYDAAVAALSAAQEQS